jgi:hypothetical protein
MLIMVQDAESLIRNECNQAEGKACEYVNHAMFILAPLYHVHVVLILLDMNAITAPYCCHQSDWFHSLQGF